MKNLFLIFLICVAAVAANAAQTSWTLLAVYDPEGTKVDNTYSAYLFTTAVASYDSWSTIKDPSAFQTAAVKGFNMPWVDAGKYTDTSSFPQHTTLGLNLQGGESYNFYAVIVNSETDKYYLTQTVSQQVSAGDLDILNIALGSQATRSQAAGAWQAVPEPFSGTLALLGMAGIALRRKLKKAKKA